MTRRAAFAGVVSGAGYRLWLRRSRRASTSSHFENVMGTSLDLKVLATSEALRAARGGRARRDLRGSRGS